MPSNRGYGDASNLSDGSISGAVLPSQYFDGVAARASDSPEKRLMFAVLLDAVVNLQRRGSVGAAEADRWIREQTDANSPFSFTNVCDSLGIESGYLRRGLLRERAGRTNYLGIARSLQRRRLRASRIVRRRRRRVQRGTVSAQAG